MIRIGKGIALAALCTVVCFGDAQRKGSAEMGLGGFRLFDAGTKLLDFFGNPDDIQPISVGGGPVGPSGPAPGGGAPAGGAPAAGGGGARGGGGRGGGGEVGDVNTDFNWGGGDTINFQNGRGRGGGGRGGDGGGDGGGAAAGGGGGAPAGGGGAAITGDKAFYTRWVYKRPAVKYGFILDRFDHIVQIEAISLKNSKITTRNGITFGATFKDIIKRYGQPEVLEISTNQLIMRYLVKNKVAFRLNRLGQDKPHQVTAIMVAAGKY